MVFVVFSCGGVSDRTPVVYGSNGTFITVEMMLQKLTKNVDLRGKPKVIIMVINKCTRAQFTGGAYKIPTNQFGQVCIFVS